MTWFAIGFVVAVCCAFAWVIGRLNTNASTIGALCASNERMRDRIHELGSQATENAMSVANLKLSVEQRLAVLEQPKPKSEDARWITAKEVAIPGRRKERV